MIFSALGYTLRDIVPNLYPESGYDADLDLLKNSSFTSQDYTHILAFLQQLGESEDALWSLTKWPNEHARPHFNSKGIDFLQTRGYNIYRIRPLWNRLSKYRIIYAYDSEFDNFYLLGVVIKDVGQDLPDELSPLRYDYEPIHHITKRLIEDFESLGLPRTH